MKKEKTSPTIIAGLITSVLFIAILVFMRMVSL